MIVILIRIDILEGLEELILMSISIAGPDVNPDSDPHIPNKYERTVRYYRFYSNKSRDMRKNQIVTSETIPAVEANDMTPKEFRHQA